MLMNTILFSSLAWAQDIGQTQDAAEHSVCSIQDFNNADGTLIVQTKYCPSGNTDQDSAAMYKAINHLENENPSVERARQKSSERGFAELDAIADAYLGLNPMTVWQGIADTPALVEYFKDTFDSIGVSVQASEQNFTVTHTGTELLLSEGIAEDVTFRVTISQKQVLNMVQNASDNRISDQESWRILSVLFTPMTAETLGNKVFTNYWNRRLIGVEDHIHVHLLNPSGTSDTSHTLFFVKGQWVVVKGLHGKPKRTFKLTPEQALEYQRKTFTALRHGNKKQQRAWAKWYKTWRNGVSETH